MNYAKLIALSTYLNKYYDAISSINMVRAPHEVIKDLCIMYRDFTSVKIGKLTYCLPNDLRIQAHDFFMKYWREQYAKIVLSMTNKEHYKYVWGSLAGYGCKEKETNC